MTKVVVELIVFNPDDFDTYPSVCVDPGEVRSRFGFTGGEVLVFTEHGSYLGQLTKSLEPLETWVPLMRALREANDNGTGDL